MKEVTLLGMGGSSRGNLEILGEVWSLNNAYCKFPGLKFNRFFELHEYNHALRTPNAQGHDHFTRLDMLGCPVYMQQPTPRVRLSRPYPLDDVCCYFATNYFIGSPSYMLALALYEGYSHIRTYGFDQIDEEHAQQRSAWTFWLSKAHEMGVRVDGVHAWLAEVDKDANEGMNAYRDSAMRALKRAVDEKRIVGKTVFVCQPYTGKKAAPPTKIPVEQKEQEK